MNKNSLKRVRNRRYPANKHNKRTMKHISGGRGYMRGGNRIVKDKFEVTTLKNIDQDTLDKFKISNYVNDNIDWGDMPGPPPTDCIIL